LGVGVATLLVLLHAAQDDRLEELGQGSSPGQAGARPVHLQVADVAPLEGGWPTAISYRTIRGIQVGALIDPVFSSTSGGVY